MGQGSGNGNLQGRASRANGGPRRFSPAKPAPKFEQILVRLREAIEDGELPIGSHHSIASLCADFEASRTPVHEACIRLMRYGLVELVERKGVLIVGTSDHDVEDIFEIRLWLEPPATELATRNLMKRPDPVKLERLKRHFEDMLLAGHEGRADDFWCADADFHEVIHEASGNARLPRYLRDLRELSQLREVVTNALIKDGIPPVAEAHRPIYEAIINHEPEKARRAMTSHIVETARVVREAQHERMVPPD
jgi:DNA-binding GntR family transcriptional regulator